MELLGRLRRAVKKLTFLLSLKKYLTSSTWRIASSIARAPTAITAPHRWGRRAYSFNDRPGLRACVEVIVISDDDHYNNNNYLDEGYNGGPSGSSSGATSPYTLQRSTSYPQEDIDNQAEMFINNFYKHLVYEKQVSLNLRYCSDNIGFNSFADDSTSTISPLSSASSYQPVSPT